MRKYGADNKLSLSQLREKILKYCLYRERSSTETETKLRHLGADDADTERLLQQLIDNNFVNDERFAYEFVHGKFKLNRWGRVKIQAALYPHKLPDSLVADAFRQAVRQDDYVAMLRKLAEKKIATLDADLSPGQRKNALVQYLLQRGFEYDEIAQIVFSE